MVCHRSNRDQKTARFLGARRAAREGVRSISEPPAGSIAGGFAGLSAPVLKHRIKTELGVHGSHLKPQCWTLFTVAPPETVKTVLGILIRDLAGGLGELSIALVLPLLSLVLPALSFGLPLLGLVLPALPVGLPLLSLVLPALPFGLPLLGLVLPALPFGLPLLGLVPKQCPLKRMRPLVGKALCRTVWGLFLDGLK